MIESRIFSARAIDKLPCWHKSRAKTIAWSCDMEGHAQMSPLHACTTITSKRKNWKRWGELSNVCPEVSVFATHWWTRHSMVCKQTSTSSNKKDQSLWQTLGSFDLLHSSHCTQNTLPDLHTRTFFSCVHCGASSAHF